MVARCAKYSKDPNPIGDLTSEQIFEVNPQVSDQSVPVGPQEILRPTDSGIDGADRCPDIVNMTDPGC